MSEQNGTAKCDVLGCIAHRAGSTLNKETQTITRFVVHFRTQEEIMKHATESMSRVVALAKRNKKALPTDRVVDIYTDLSFTKTIDDELNEISAMSEAQRKEYERQLMLRYAAYQKLQTLTASTLTSAEKESVSTASAKR